VLKIICVGALLCRSANALDNVDRLMQYQCIMLQFLITGKKETLEVDSRPFRSIAAVLRPQKQTQFLDLIKNLTRDAVLQYLAFNG
jgi:hypothetical protein